MGEEVVVPFSAPPDRVPPVSHIRGTTISTSLQTLREMRLVDAYFDRLSAKNRERVLSIVAASWVPIELACLHYGTCDALDLGTSTAEQIGSAVSHRIQGTFLGTVLRAASGAGAVTPWTPLLQIQRLYDRVFQGGAVAVFKLGPKEARIEHVGNALCAIGYFRKGLRGIVGATGELFGAKYVMRELHSAETSVSYRVSWA